VSTEQSACGVPRAQIRSKAVIIMMSNSIGRHRIASASRGDPATWGHLCETGARLQVLANWLTVG
jgi:hypothetical protein